MLSCSSVVVRRLFRSSRFFSSIHYNAKYLERCEANFEQLSPLSYLKRTAMVYPEYLALLHGDSVSRTWSEVAVRCTKYASALSNAGVRRGDTVSIIAPNTPAQYESTFAVPMAGAVLNPINVRLDASNVAYILEHAESKVLLVDREYSAMACAALQLLPSNVARPLVIDIDDPEYKGGGKRISSLEYESFVASGDASFRWLPPEDEWDAIALNYTSGTTGRPKGVVYHNRGAFLNAASNALVWDMKKHPVYLWTLPLFHCNGWCFPWTLAMRAGRNVCLRDINNRSIYDAIEKFGVTHLCGAPIIIDMLLNVSPPQRELMRRRKQESGGFALSMMTAAAPPPPRVLQAAEELGVDVTHVYGLTETYGPAAGCAWKEAWQSLSAGDKAATKSRQGVMNDMQEDIKVGDPSTGAELPWDGVSMGEIFFRGNIVMKGYFKNEEATKSAFRTGWFASGDLAVRHADGYVQIKDRAKDIIISGGENISTLEVETCMYRHSAVAEVAVVAMPDEKWGERPCAFVGLAPGYRHSGSGSCGGDKTVSEEELIEYCKQNMSRFMAPARVVFGPLPKTNTGKVQKYVLRSMAKELVENK